MSRQISPRIAPPDEDDRSLQETRHRAAVPSSELVPNGLRSGFGSHGSSLCLVGPQPSLWLCFARLHLRWRRTFRGAPEAPGAPPPIKLKKALPPGKPARVFGARRSPRRRPRVSPANLQARKLAWSRAGPKSAPQPIRVKAASRSNNLIAQTPAQAELKPAGAAVPRRNTQGRPKWPFSGVALL
jgi:hypothetical protein